MPIGIKVQKAGPGQKEISGRSGKSRIFNTAEQDRKNREMKKRTSMDKRTGPKEPISKKEGGMFRRSAQAVKENKSGSYKIKSGDSLSAIAKARGTTVKKLMEMNPSIKNANMIRAGASLKVPPKTEVSKMTGSKKSPYRGMTSKEITSGTMQKSGSKTSGAKKSSNFSALKEKGVGLGPARKTSPKAGSAKPYAKPSGASSAKPKGKLLDRFMPGKANSRKKAREEIPLAAKKGGAMKKTKGYASGGAMALGSPEMFAHMSELAKKKKQMSGKKMAYGGKVRGMGAAKKGGKFSRSC